MTVKLITDTELSQYQQFCDAYGSVFNSSRWLAMFDSGIELYGIFDTSGKLIGGFYLKHTQKFGLHIHSSPSFTPSCGLFYVSVAQNQAKKLSIQKQVVEAVASFLSQLPYGLVMFPLPCNITDTQPFYWQKFKTSVGYTYRVALNTSIEKIQNNLQSERRSDMNRALRENIVVQKTTDMNIVLQLVNQTFRRKQTNVNEHVLNKILFDFSQPENSFAFVAYRDQTPIAGTFCIHDKHTAYYLLGGMQSEGKHGGAGSLCVWESIKYAHQAGLQCFDFEGSMLQPIEKYFRSFGGELTPYYIAAKAWLPLEIALKFVKRQIF